MAKPVSVIGSAPPKERYGSKVLLVSSGKEEWVQQMKERLGGKKEKTTPPPVADAPYKSQSVWTLCCNVC